MRKWRIEDSEELYNITGWGTSYFGINDKGHVVVTPRKNGVGVDLKELVDELQLRDVAAPMLIRFPDILDNRIEKTSSCFRQAAEEYGYKAQNFIIYPIKVNQMRPVVEEIISHGKKFNLGLEAGSKPELHAVIAINSDSDSLIICNGYKDESYIELALLAQKMGKRIFLVVEKMNELKLIAKMAKQLNVMPNIGIRIKLASSGSGKWEDSGGDASKFGLSSSELLEALDFLDSKGLKDCLKLIHFHIGSQVTKIRRIKTALREASQFYVQLHAMGFKVEFVDIGGGLGVDYDGTRSSSSYKAQNFIIYPIKVNQMRPVVEEIISHGKKFNLGLEAGSKPELHAVIAINSDSDSLIICNGYKDESYIELALLAQKMGKRIFLVVEKMNELKLIAKMAKQLNVMPNIGIRIKLASSGSGKWEDSGGDASKFGLSSSELLEALDFLDSKGLKDCLKLIHFHIGSQVTKIRRIKTALREASQFYVQLHAMGFKVEFVDIGGGLGVDYDGTRSSSSESSVNYSIQEYVNDSISTLVDASDKNGIPHPNIITESGRALTAHHSVLIFEVLETTTLPEWDDDEEVTEEDHELVQELYGIWDTLNQNKMLEAWHDAQQIREEALDLFSHGIVDLKTRAQIERLYWSVMREVNQIAGGLKHAPDELRGLPKLLADKYFCNFSLFQSLPDSWAIDQIFPIMPIQRLDERPDRAATLQDITCDSDGKIANFISTKNVAHYLPTHSLKSKEPYYMGVFLVGAYQEILGDMHNLFGDTNAVHVSVNEKGYTIEQVIDGETVAEVLDYVQYSPKKLVRTLETWVTQSVKEGRISLEEGKEFLSNYRSGLYGYTYLE